MPNCDFGCSICATCDAGGTGICPLEHNKTITNLKKKVEDLESKVDSLERQIDKMAS